MTKTFLSTAGLLLLALPVFAQSPAKPLTPPDVLGAAKVVAGSRNHQTLLAAGTVAPDFTVQDKDGNYVKLSNYRGKTVILDFWATWCGVCIVALHRSAKIAEKHPGKNVVVLAVNVLDTPSAFRAWQLKQADFASVNFAFDPSMTHVAALYHVSGLPTQYVISPDGKIVKSIVGYETGDTQLEDALKMMAGN